MAVRDEVYVAACSDYEEKRVEECIRRMFEDQGGAEVFLKKGKNVVIKPNPVSYTHLLHLSSLLESRSRGGDKPTSSPVDAAKLVYHPFFPKSRHFSRLLGHRAFFIVFSRGKGGGVF